MSQELPQQDAVQIVSLCALSAGGEEIHSFTGLWEKSQPGTYR
ncbi:hypothetical protein WDV06_33360 [Streptomyces racemochromogenes]|uniref:Uncharacterized protein n=1 Tax=Streptomyces racemochromogenes TaxID=67353 RepID=A0ABW7PPW8_9ACTN